MKSLKITFVDFKGEFTESINDHHSTLKPFFNNLETYAGDILEFHAKHSDEPGLAYLSPANSLGFMDSGIDIAYSRNIFPDIEKEVKWNIKNLKHHNLVGQAYLPIGSALITKRNHQFLISAPTMWLPQDVSETNNAKNSFLGTLYAIHMWNHYFPSQHIQHLVCPGLATGYGKMTGEQSVKQIEEAVKEFDLSKLQPYHWKWFLNTRTYMEEKADVVNEQPNYYQNTQWKQINSSSIKKVN